jgi:transposase
MTQIEVLSSPERRRRWTAEQKRWIVAEAFAPGASVCEVARRADVVPSLIYRWRRELGSTAAGFAQVMVAPGADQRAVTSAALEIEFGRDIRVRIAAAAPKELACAIIKVLAAR